MSQAGAVSQPPPDPGALATTSPHAQLRSTAEPVSAVPATADKEGSMSPAQYRQLADRLILDQEAWGMYFNRCKCIAGAKFYGHTDPQTIASAGLKGMSMGMSFMEALSRIKVIHGQPVIRGPAAINHIHERCGGARCRCITGLIGSGADIGIPDFDLERLTERIRNRYPQYWTEDNLGLNPNKISVWVMDRPGWAPKAFIYTWEQAELAELPKRNDSYRKFPARCLKWQAASEGAQEMFGDVLDGLYFEVELERAQPEPKPKTRAKRQSKTKPKGETKPAPETKSEPAPEPKSEPAPEPKPEPKPEPEAHGDPDQEPEENNAPESTPEANSEPAPNPEPKAQGKTDGGQHPKVAQMSFLLDAAAAASAQPGTDEFKEARKAAYREACQKALGKDLGNKPPTLPQLDKLIAHLMGAS